VKARRIRGLRGGNPPSPPVCRRPRRSFIPNWRIILMVREGINSWQRRHPNLSIINSQRQGVRGRDGPRKGAIVVPLPYLKFDSSLLFRGARNEFKPKHRFGIFTHWSVDIIFPCTKGKAMVD